MAGKADLVEFGRAADLLEEIRVDLDNSMADYFVQSLAEADGGTVPDVVKHASREAFKASSMHGLAAAAMDPHEHNKMAAASHGKAAMLAKKHGLVVLAHTHRVKEAGHHKAAKAAATDTEESRQPGMMSGVGRPKKMKKEARVPGMAMGVGRPKKTKQETVGYRSMGKPGMGMRPMKPKKEAREPQGPELTERGRPRPSKGGPKAKTHRQAVRDAWHRGISGISQSGVNQR